MSATPILPTDRRNIRRMALGMTVWIWIIGFCVARYASEPPPRALVLSALQAFGGLGAWWCYHLISRRNDGMATFIMAVNVLHQSRPDRPLTLELEVRLAGIAFLAAMMIAVAFIGRLIADKKSKPTTPPLWDEEVDQPAISG